MVLIFTLVACTRLRLDNGEVNYEGSMCPLFSLINTVWILWLPSHVMMVIL